MSSEILSHRIDKQMFSGTPKKMRKKQELCLCPKRLDVMRPQISCALQ